MKVFQTLSLLLCSMHLTSYSCVSLSRDVLTKMHQSKKVATLISCAAFAQPLRKISDIVYENTRLPQDICKIINGYRLMNHIAPRLWAASLTVNKVFQRQQHADEKWVSMERSDAVYSEVFYLFKHMCPQVNFQHFLVSPDGTKKIYNDCVYDIKTNVPIMGTRWNSQEKWRWSLDSKRLISVEYKAGIGRFPEIYLFDFDKMAHVPISPHYDGNQPPKTNHLISDVALNSNGSQLAIAYECWIFRKPTWPSYSSGLVKIIDTQTNKVIREFEPKNKKNPDKTGIKSISYMTHDKHLIIFGDCGLQILDVASGNLLACYTVFDEQRIRTAACDSHQDSVVLYTGSGKVDDGYDDSVQRFAYCQFWQSSFDPSSLTNEIISLLELLEMWRASQACVKLPTFAYAYNLDIADVKRVINSCNQQAKINGAAQSLKDVMYRVYDIREAK